MRPPALTHPSAAIFLGDCLDVLAEMPDNSVDAIVTDPPYGLEFMGKEWDAPWKTGNGFRRADNPADVGRELGDTRPRPREHTRTLTGLLDPRMRVEIEAVAYAPGDDR